MPLIRKIEAGRGTRIGLWKITESADEMREALKLSPAEEKCFSGFRSESRKKQWLASRLILAALSEKPAFIRYDDRGKPGLVNMSGYISITHSGEMAALILSDSHPVGIDIEKIRDRIEKVKERFLSPAELDWVGDSDRLEKLYILWGAKESLYKIAGNPHLDFCTDIIVEPFDYLCNKKGHCAARMKVGGSEEQVKITYEKMDDYLLVYAPGG